MNLQLAECFCSSEAEWVYFEYLQAILRPALLVPNQLRTPSPQHIVACPKDWLLGPPSLTVLLEQLYSLLALSLAMSDEKHCEGIGYLHDLFVAQHGTFYILRHMAEVHSIHNRLQFLTMLRQI